MTSDKDLLKSAAKAVDLQLIPYTWNEGTGFDHEGYRVAGDPSGNEWNPLEDEAEALRLAIELRMSIHVFSMQSGAFIPGSDVHCVSHIEINAVQATCRAIVLAAAQKGGSA